MEDTILPAQPSPTNMTKSSKNPNKRTRKNASGKSSKDDDAGKGVNASLVQLLEEKPAGLTDEEFFERVNKFIPTDASKY